MYMHILPALSLTISPACTFGSYIYIYVYMYVYMLPALSLTTPALRTHTYTCMCSLYSDGVATISRLLKMLGLFCKRDL